MGLTKPIIIDYNYWKNGQGQSSTMGMPAEIRQMEIDYNNGVLRQAHNLTKDSASIVTSLVNALVSDTTNAAQVAYGCTTDGKVYRYNYNGSGTMVNLVARPTGTTPTLAGGLAIAWKYLFLFNGTNIDVYGPLDGTTTATGGTIATTGNALTGTSTNFDAEIIAGDTLVVGTPGGTEYYAGVAIVTDDTHIVLSNAGFYNEAGVAINITAGSTYKYRRWTDDWETSPLISATNNHSLIGQNNFLYICHDKYIASIKEVDTKTFDPADNTTYSLNEYALKLPSSRIAQCLTELRQYLLVGTIARSEYDTFGYIYPWDKFSDTYDWPITTGSNGVYQIIADKGYAYSIDVRGKIYATDGLNVKEYQKISWHNNFFTDTTTLTLYPYAVANYNGKILFGIGFNGDSISSTAVGIYALFNGNIIMEHIISTGTVASSNLYIGALLPGSAGKLLVSWRDNTAYGIDRSANTYPSDYSSYLITELFQVGTKQDDTKFQRICVNLAKPLIASGNVDGVRISWRDDILGSWTDLTAMTTNDTQSFWLDFGQSLTSLQLKIALKTSTNTTSPELYNVIIEPAK